MIGELLVGIVLRVAGDAVGAVARAVLGLKEERPAPEDDLPPVNASPEAMETATRFYERWARGKGLGPAGRHAWRGMLAGADVVFRTGLAGSTPAGVEIELALPNDVEQPVLVTRGRGMRAELAPAFERLGRSLRSMGLTKTKLRMRLAPLADLPKLDAAWEELEVIVRARAERARAAPFR